jgi:hypothetical protein
VLSVYKTSKSLDPAHPTSFILTVSRCLGLITFVLVEGASKGDHVSFLYYGWDFRGGVVGSSLSSDFYPYWTPKLVVDSLA